MYSLPMRVRQVVLAMCTVAFTGFANPAAATVVINTYPGWVPPANVFDFGCPNTTTYGQVITVPAGVTNLRKFTFSWVNNTTGSMKVRGYVYAWDDTAPNFRAIGPAVFRSGRKTISFGDGLFHKVSFKNQSIPVTPGAKYVIFASIDEDYGLCTSGYTLGWADMADTVYGGGDFVYQNNGGVPANWTTVNWSTFGVDLAFKVVK